MPWGVRSVRRGQSSGCGASRARGILRCFSPASSRVPDRALAKRRTIGVRIPDNAVPRAIVEALGCPLVTTSVKADDDAEEYATDPELIHERYGRDVAIVVDGGIGDRIPTAVVDLTGDEPEILREGPKTLN